MIELLVVVSVIAVILGISLFGLQGARKSSRDARRKTDLETIRSGLELYRADNAQYPANTADLASDYISVVPEDPQTSDPYDYSSICGDSGDVCGRTVDCTGIDCCAYQLEATLESDPLPYQVCNP